MKRIGLISLVFVANIWCGARGANNENFAAIGQPSIFWHNNEWETYHDGVWAPYGQSVTNAMFAPGGGVAGESISGQSAEVSGRRRGHIGGGRRSPSEHNVEVDPGTTGAGIGQPNTGIGQPNLGIGQPNLGIGTPNIGIGEPNLGIGRPNTGIGRTPTGLGMPTGRIGRRPGSAGPTPASGKRRSGSGRHQPGSANQIPGLARRRWG